MVCVYLWMNNRYREIERYIQGTCKGQYELKLLDKVSTS